MSNLRLSTKKAQQFTSFIGDVHRRKHDVDGEETAKRNTELEHSINDES